MSVGIDVEGKRNNRIVQKISFDMVVSFQVISSLHPWFIPSKLESKERWRQ